MKILIVILAAIALPTDLAAQSAADGRVLAALGVEPTAQLKLFNPAGSIRLVAWDRDSIVIRGDASPRNFFFGGTRRGAKGGVEDPAVGDTARPVRLVAYVPRHGTVSVKAVSADIASSDLAGWYYTVSGTVRVTGAVNTLDVESMSGNIDLDVVTPWVRARTGQGHLLVRGSPQDIDASTVGGALDIAASSILRGRFASVTGDIRYAATPVSGALFEFSSHSGTVDFLLPAVVSARFDLTSVTGEIANGFTHARPVSSGPHTLRIDLGRADAQVSVRTFKGTIRLRPRS